MRELRGAVEGTGICSGADVSATEALVSEGGVVYIVCKASCVVSVAAALGGVAVIEHVVARFGNSAGGG